MSTYAIYFSPTGGTRKVVELLTSELDSCTEIDLIGKGVDKDQAFGKDDVCVIGVPSYGGRVPAVTLKAMEGFQGGCARTVLVVVFGNRAYDDTLVELQDFLVERNFCPVAAVAAVAEHSVVHEFGEGRPDDRDRAELKRFAKTIKSGLEKGACTSALQLPGNHPFKEYQGIPLKPKATKKCTKCGVCAAGCPVGAIPVDAPDKTDVDACISCMRCINVCPHQAREVNGLMMWVAARKMKKVCTTRKANELFVDARE